MHKHSLFAAFGPLRFRRDAVHSRAYVNAKSMAPKVCKAKLFMAAGTAQAGHPWRPEGARITRQSPFKSLPGIALL
ncbi:MAG: hypothetical protein RR311_00705 [Comamonas sp.]